MTVTVVAMTSINEEEPMALAEYLRVTGPLLERAGAKILKRFTINEVVVGHRPAKTVFIVEYPDKAAVNSVFGSPEYRAIREIRDSAFTSYSVTVAADASDAEMPALAVD
ncbi:MAG: DUF1330 domain-containing protein [Cognatishimia sp.]